MNEGNKGDIVIAILVALIMPAIGLLHLDRLQKVMPPLNPVIHPLPRDTKRC